jgi:hypothetical protein
MALSWRRIGMALSWRRIGMALSWRRIGMALSWRRISNQMLIKYIKIKKPSMLHLFTFPEVLP